MKKVAQKLFIALRRKTLRKSCCVATHNEFWGILTGASKIYDLLPYKYTHYLHKRCYLAQMVSLI